MSQRTPWSAESDPGQRRGPRPRSFAILLLVTIRGWVSSQPRLPGLPPAGRDKGDGGPRWPCKGPPWKQPRPPRPGPSQAGLQPREAAKADEVTARTRPPAGAAQGASGPLGPAPAGTGNAVVTSGKRAVLRAPGQGDRSRSSPAGGIDPDRRARRPRSPAHAARSGTGRVPTSSRPSSGR